jgi:uncharacterized protein
MHAIKSERIESLDMMRGFAIFGIFLVNMLSFHSPLLYLDPFSWWTSKLDQGTYIFIDIFAQGSFYPLFSLLFGYGFIILQERTAARGEPFRPIAFRRFTMLLVIGVLHAFLIWHGDILMNYAIFGFLLLFFLKLSGKGMLAVGSLLWLIPNIILCLLFVVIALFAPLDEVSIYDTSMAQQSVEYYQQGSYGEIFKQRFEDWYAVNNLANATFMVFSIFPFFLIGGGAAKLKWMERVKELRKSLTTAFFLLLSGGLLLKVSPYLFDKNFSVEYIQDSIGGPMLAMAYALGIALLAERSQNCNWLKAFVPVGRMSMSNYLFQSVISTLIFYSYGLGLYNKVSAWAGTLLVVLIFCLQISLSSYWMKTHYYGPVEWLWRSVTYKKKQKWKRVV